MRSGACDTLIRLCARHVLCWLAFPLVPALRSIDSAAADSAADCSAAGRHIVRRLPSYYGEVRRIEGIQHGKVLRHMPQAGDGDRNEPDERDWPEEGIHPGGPAGLDGEQSN